MGDWQKVVVPSLLTQILVVSILQAFDGVMTHASELEVK